MNRLILPLFAALLLVPDPGRAQKAAATSPLAIPKNDEGLPGAGPIRRYDWFEKLWLAKRTGWAERVLADQGAVVFLGDSITQGWGNDFKGQFRGMKKANRGISGDTTRGMLIRLEEDVLALNPAGVVLLMGTNDIEEKGDPAETAANVGIIIDRLKAHRADLPIILCRVLPSHESKKRPAAVIEKLNALVDSAVKGDPSVTVIDTWKLFDDGTGNATKALQPDLLHLNGAGYEKWAGALRPVLATHGFLEKITPAFELEAGFEFLFNGRDLTGWGFQPTQPRRPSKSPNAPVFAVVEKAVAFDGMTESSDRRYRAIAGRLVVATPPEGRRIQQLWTTREFDGDFTLKLQFRATPNADSGIFLKGKQLQCRDYHLAGPYEHLKNYKPGDWNKIVVVVRGTKAHCTCNGEVLEEAYEVPAKGRIGLEGDRGQIEYRFIRLRND